MTFTCPKAQQFHDKFCAPIFDKYRNDNDFIVTTPDGVKLFDVQLAMLKEHQTFFPVFNAESKVIAFTVQGYPQYLLADTNHSGGAKHQVTDLFFYMMRRYSESRQTTGIITYHGFRDVYAVDNACGISGEN